MAETTPDHALKAIAADTTLEQQKVTKSRRDINLIWEATQAIIAIAITIAVIYGEATGRNSTVLSNAFTLIVAIYFVRMNHTKMGGLSSSDQERK